MLHKTISSIGVVLEVSGILMLSALVYRAMNALLT